MKRMNRAIPLIAALLAAGALCAKLPAQESVPESLRREIIADLVRGADGTWRSVTTPGRRYGVRALFSSMLAYALADTHPERIAVFIERAEALQERRAGHRRFGNFFWYSDETEVLDANAVDFCMQHAALLWMFHRDALEPEIRERFRAMLALGLEGLHRHLPRPDYTNIALLNASDLILLGQALENAEAVAEGSRRLSVFIRTLWEQGVREYVSPTYYGINLESALLLEALASDAAVRQSAAAIRELLEKDIALNRLDRRVVLSGTCSRTYDFLFKRGELDQALVPFGWMAPPAPGGGTFRHRFFARLYSPHHPDDATLALSERFPRTVTQRWGFSPRESRVHYLCRDVSLSTSASIYGQMDIPLSVDLPYSGDRPEVQLYFLPDGRDDPYAKKRIAAGNHNKALHLTPWWCAVQERSRAMALALYDAGTVAHITDGLQSHIIFRRALDALYIDDRRIDIAALHSTPETLHAGACLFLRAATAAVAIRIPWSQGQGGAPAQTRLIDDGNPHGALRLTTAHALPSGPPPPQSRCAGILYAIETGSGLTTDREFAEFRAQFRAAPPAAADGGEGLSFSWRRAGTALLLACDSLTAPAAATVHPKPSMPVLALDGDDIGRRVLEQSPSVRAYVDARRTAVPVAVPPAQSVTWPALNGSWSVPLERGEDDGRPYLWVAEEAGAKAWNAGVITWEIDLQQSGDYHIEAEILAPTPEDDSFFVSARSVDGDAIIPEFAWSTGVDKNWRWSRVICRDLRPHRDTFRLPQGPVTLIFRTREAGIKISRLRLIPQRSEE